MRASGPFREVMPATGGIGVIRKYRVGGNKHHNSHEIMGSPRQRSCLIGFLKDDLDLSRERKGWGELFGTHRWKSTVANSILSFFPCI